MQYFKVYWRQWECGQLVFVPNSCIIYKLLFSKGHLEIDKAKCVFAVTVHSEYLWIHCKKDAHFSFLQRFMGILCASPCESVCIFREWHLNHSGFDFSFCMSIKPSSHTWLFSHSFIPYNFYTYLNIHLQIHYSSIHSHTHTLVHDLTHTDFLNHRLLAVIRPAFPVSLSPPSKLLSHHCLRCIAMPMHLILCREITQPQRRRVMTHISKSSIHLPLNINTDFIQIRHYKCIL